MAQANQIPLQPIKELAIPTLPPTERIVKLADALGIPITRNQAAAIAGSQGGHHDDAARSELVRRLSQRIEALLVMPLQWLAEHVLRPGPDFQKARCLWLGWRKFQPFAGEAQQQNGKPQDVETVYLFWGTPLAAGAFDEGLPSGGHEIAGFRGALVMMQRHDGQNAGWAWIGWQGGEAGWAEFLKRSRRVDAIVHTFHWSRCPDPPQNGCSAATPLAFTCLLALELAEMLLTGNDISWLAVERMGVDPAAGITNVAERRAQMAVAEAVLSEWCTAFDNWKVGDDDPGVLMQTLIDATLNLMPRQQEWLRRSREKHTLSAWGDEPLNAFLSKLLFGHLLPIPQSVCHIHDARTAVVIPGIEFSGDFERRRNKGVGCESRKLRVAWVLGCPACKRVRDLNGSCRCPVPVPVYEAVYWYLIDGHCAETTAWRCQGNCVPDGTGHGPLQIGAGPGIHRDGRFASACPVCSQKAWGRKPTHVFVPVPPGGHWPDWEHAPECTTADFSEELHEEWNALRSLSNNKAAEPMLRDAAKKIDEFLGKLLPSMETTQPSAGDAREPEGALQDSADLRDQFVKEIAEIARRHKLKPHALLDRLAGHAPKIVNILRPCWPEPSSSND